ncbi:MAG: tRNA (adenine-N(1)-)-methyltransferase catalytic subunit trm61 [Sclerophora amabilis]|nr:MAG: tRNA (adenine-N(1)-)-methyltransferase catalytic subunit trm61 [Sclerophora amabilis]
MVMTVPSSRPSPFLDPGPSSSAESLAVLHLKRELLLPTKLSEHDEKNEGYAEGRVTNTRFGSFPHSTLIGLPWGSQVRASDVDTGSRGRKGKNQVGKKRKRGEDVAESASVERDDDSLPSGPTKTPVAASTGFIHLLPPTPELWTSSLPHRTQVVYTPDYSYILHRLRVRPGSVIIEAGAGSGSFSHAAARAVFNGYPGGIDGTPRKPPAKGVRAGKVWSYEFHDQRAAQLRAEIREHGLEGIVEVTHRDVCQDGFMLGESDTGLPIPEVEAIFLDLPAPWVALPHLMRSPRSGPPVTADQSPAISTSKSPPSRPQSPILNTRKLSPLNPQTAIHLCTFSPCIEQVQRTISTLRQLGWMEIEMVEISQKRLEVRRERIGLQEEGVRGVNSSAATVDEAVNRLKEVEGRFRPFHQQTQHAGTGADASDSKATSTAKTEDEDGQIGPSEPASQPTRSGTGNGNGNVRSKLIESMVDRKLYKEGRLIHRLEPELKTHTSYLVFAILPREWTAEDEERANKRWPVTDKTGTSEEPPSTSSNRKMSKGQAKKTAATNLAGHSTNAEEGKELVKEQGTARPSNAEPMELVNADESDSDLVTL